MGVPAEVAGRVEEAGGQAADLEMLRRAIVLAEGGRGAVSPNPLVGAVVRGEDGRVVGEGFHAAFGQDHAEVVALAEAGSRARGGTIYVTLEPCAHHGKTPPCVDAVVAAGIRRVVYAVPDPHPQAAGGAVRLRQAGLAVEERPAVAAEVRRQNAAFFKAQVRGLPYVVAKWAMTLDGRIAGPGGRPRRITGPEARRHAHALRADADAVVVGVGTLLSDDPLLTVRDVPVRRPPRRVVFDSVGRTPAGTRLVRSARESPVWIVVGDEADPGAVRGLEVAGCRVLRVRGGRRPDVAAFARTVLSEGVAHLLVEGGPTLHGAFLGAGLVDRVHAYIAPEILGVTGAPVPVEGLGGGGLRLTGVTVQRLGADTVIAGDVGGEGGNT